MVKGNVYGYGIEMFVLFVVVCGVEYFSVFDVSEAYWVRKSF